MQGMMDGGGCGVPGQGSMNAIGKLNQGMMQQQVATAAAHLFCSLTPGSVQQMAQQMGQMQQGVPGAQVTSSSYHSHLYLCTSLNISLPHLSDRSTCCVNEQCSAARCGLKAELPPP